MGKFPSEKHRKKSAIQSVFFCGAADRKISRASLSGGPPPRRLPEARGNSSPNPPCSIPNRQQIKKDRKETGLFCGAADRDRTGTTVARREILSLLRLPIPPQRRASEHDEPPCVLNIIETTPFVKKKCAVYREGSTDAGVVQGEGRGKGRRGRPLRR